MVPGLESLRCPNEMGRRVGEGYNLMCPAGYGVLYWAFVKSKRIPAERKGNIYANEVTLDPANVGVVRVNESFLQFPQDFIEIAI